MCYDDVSVDYAEDRYDAGYSNGYESGYESGRSSREWELEDYASDVAEFALHIEELATMVGRLKAALCDAGVHPNLVEVIANG